MIRRRAAEWILTFRQSCLSWCCHLWSPCCPAESLGSSSPQQCRSRCSAGWYSEASWSHRLRSTGCAFFSPHLFKIIHEKKEINRRKSQTRQKVLQRLFWVVFPCVSIDLRCVCLFVSICQPCNELATLPGCTPTAHPVAAGIDSGYKI